MHFDRGAQELEELNPGDLVRIQPQQSKLQKRKDWKLARIEGKVDIRSYQVRTEGGRVYRRNRRHLRRTRETPSDRSLEEVLPTRPNPSSPSPSCNVPKLSTTPGTSESQKQQAAVVQRTPVKHLVPSASSKQETAPPVITTRSGREIRPPTRFAD